eukprot:712129-Prorocentrum_minimum.AAC.2
MPGGNECAVIPTSSTAFPPIILCLCQIPYFPYLPGGTLDTLGEAIAGSRASLRAWLCGSADAGRRVCGCGSAGLRMRACGSIGAGPRV